METQELLHILRNPYGFSDEDVRKARLAADEIEKIEKLNKDIKDYVFTFTSRSELRFCYVVIHDTYTSARDRMCKIFGDKWAFQYENETKAGVKQYNLKCLITL